MVIVAVYCVLGARLTEGTIIAVLLVTITVPASRGAARGAPQRKAWKQRRPGHRFGKGRGYRGIHCDSCLGVRFGTPDTVGGDANKST